MTLSARPALAGPLAAMLIIALPVAAWSGDGGSVLDHCTMKSAILGGERAYAVYLPPDYATSSRSYPVLYLLHGSGDDQTGWVQFGEVLHIADRAIADGSATPMVIVMPDANTGHRGYSNTIRGTWLYEDFFFKEFVPLVEKTYRIRAEKRYRAIAGLSMGGGGTFRYALHHPEMFSSACPLSASIRPLRLEDTRGSLSSFREADTTGLSDAQVEAYFKRESVLSLVENMPDSLLNAVRWYIDCGDKDRLSEGNCLVHNAMLRKGIPHEFRIREGAHTWTYWRASLPDVLRFVSDAFHQY
ncbi:MAG TPA: alpha/beta hydrolase-fold protein [Bacteroidota bacterium]|nr:alpha/beta hydrolase-fold protein [Bacteroidota bacterium]